MASARTFYRGPQVVVTSRVLALVVSGGLAFAHAFLRRAARVASIHARLAEIRLRDTRGTAVKRLLSPNRTGPHLHFWVSVRGRAHA